MKLIYVVIDGMGDLPIEELGNQTPLEAAETPHLDHLANTGTTGLMYTVGKGIAPESDVAVVSILGYDPFKHDVSRGVLEALGADLSVKDGDLALRCNFATVVRKNQILDRRVGRSLTTEEATELGHALTKEINLTSHPASFEFQNTIGHRAALVIRSNQTSLSGNISNTDPAYARVEGLGVARPNAEMTLNECTPTDKTEAAKISARLVNEFVQKSRLVLEKHEVNKKRVARGALSANIILTRDAGHRLPKFSNLNKRYDLTFACLADMPAERGISKLAGMRVIPLPPPSKSLRNDCLHRVKKLLEALPSDDCCYVHIKGPDEPSHDGDFTLKTQEIATIDEYFFGNLLQQIELKDHVVCVTADHSTPCKLKAHSDDPVPVLIAGNEIEGDGAHGFSEKECSNGSMGVLKRGVELMPKLVAYVTQ